MQYAQVLGMINSQVVHLVGLSSKPHISPYSLPYDGL
jgi:hypothetical protein